MTRSSSPLLLDVQHHFANGLLARWVARLTEVALLAENLDYLSLAGRAANQCVAQVEAARGRLIHRAMVTDGRVQEYHVLAPTEWNFHPQGILVQGLYQLRGDPAQIEQQARMLIHAIDPCVACDLKVLIR